MPEPDWFRLAQIRGAKRWFVQVLEVKSIWEEHGLGPREWPWSTPLCQQANDVVGALKWGRWPQPPNFTGVVETCQLALELLDYWEAEEVEKIGSNEP